MTPAAEGNRGKGRSTAAALAVVSLVWVLAALTVPLFPDEFYYWTWSRHLAAGYFDHPPAIAWLIRAGTVLFGPTMLGVRAPSLVCGLLAAVAIGRMATRLGSASAGPRAILLFAVMPLITGSFVLATPDAPLLAAVAWSLYAVLRAVEVSPSRSHEAIGWWALAGVLLGVAGLSKYTAVLIPVGLALVVLLYWPLRPLLATPGPYFAAALAAAIVSPVVLWNAGHEWISFRFQLGHGLGAGRGGSILDRELNLVALQFLTATPILFGFMVAGVGRGLRRRDDQRAVMLAGVALFVALFFVWSAIRSHAEANWPAVAYPAAVALLAAWPLGRLGRRWLGAGVILSGSLTLLLLVHLATPLLPLPLEPQATSQAYGWTDISQAVERARVAAGSGGGALHYGTNRYQDAAAISYFLPSHPEAYAFNWHSRPNQYDLWPQFPDIARPGDRMLLVVNEGPEDETTVVRVLAPHFTSVERGELVEPRMPSLNGKGQQVNRRRIWLLSGWRGTWPNVVRPGP